jgi:hypothetical protein
MRHGQKYRAAVDQIFAEEGVRTYIDAPHALSSSGNQLRGTA